MRRASAFHASLHRPKMVMGADPVAFYGAALLGSLFFAMGAYAAVPVAFIAIGLGRWMSKKDPQFMRIFLRYVDEKHAYSALPRPSDWANRPNGWGRGLPW